MLAATVLGLDLLLILFTGIAGVLGLIALLVAATFVLARVRSSPRPAPLGVWGQGKLWCGEIAAAWSIFLIAMPFERWLMPRDHAGPRTDSLPVLLIHGYVNNAGAMWRLRKALVHNGLRVYTLNLEPVYASLDHYAPLIRARIEAIVLQSGAPDVTLVCHSMGGLAARAYLRDCAQKKIAPGVAKAITLGSPHHGTVLARIEFSPNGKQMAPGNAWLADLAGHEHGAWACPLVSVYSFDDNMVAPQLSAHLDGARNIALAGVGHMSLPLSRRVMAIVLREIGQRETA